MYGIIKTGGLTYIYNRFHANYCIIEIIYIYINTYEGVYKYIHTYISKNILCSTKALNNLCTIR